MKYTLHSKGLPLIVETKMSISELTAHLNQLQLDVKIGVFLDTPH